MHLDTRLLRSFLTVASELNFSRAAQRLHMSQQALSAQIQRLELGVGAALFVRTTRYVRLTDAGHVLLPYAESMITCTDRAERALRSLDGSGAERLRVGFSTGAALDLTAPILAAFAGLRPQVRVELREAPLSDPSAGLADGGADAAFVRLPLGCDGLDHLDLLHDPRVLLVHESHPLAARASVTFAEVADAPLIVCRTRDRRWDDFWLAVDARGGAQPRVSHEVSTLDEEMLLVATRGAMSISVATAARWPHPPGLAFVPITDLAPSVVALAWARDATSPVLADLVAAATAVRERPPHTGGVPRTAGRPPHRGTGPA
ncbi:LysR family transcriptional regulator [Streptomyces sp. NPDC051940]|uniref:LysR substrate-binding domain-containing protein n=1 Tax=Streptomyces sp. NPDC051940 TaxID=3155675 RepID=UPI00341528DF